ncbi:MAG TPA: pilus assembly protein TadG-related protein [Pseudolabrys sp.]|nr:pilus assembly protein TadG-related protein [Pseudolabrys sp.]
MQKSKASYLGFIALKLRRRLANLRADQGGTVAVMMAFLLPVLAGSLGLGFEISGWYLRTRAMQNAADAAAIAAATNAGANYDVEAKAVTAQEGFVDGTNNVTVTVSNTALCPAGGNDCYSVKISNFVPLYLAQIVGFSGDAIVNGTRGKSLSSAAVAKPTKIKQPICLLGLDTNGTAIRSNGAPNADFTGCAIMSNSNETCNGSNLNAYLGLASGTNSGCGNTQLSNIPTVSDPYSALASSIPTDLSTRCSNSYPQESRKGSVWSGGTEWSGTKTLTGTASLAGNTLICGDLRLTADVTIDAPDGATLFIDNGVLDLQGHTFKTASGSSVTIVFTGTNSGSYQHIPIDNQGGGAFDFEAPKSGPFSGLAIYQDPNLTSGVDITYSGNNPTWEITGGVYLPNANLRISGAVNKSSNGGDCFVMVAKTVLINGTGSIYQQSPNGSGCKSAGLNMPTAIIQGRGQLVY